MRLSTSLVAVKKIKSTVERSTFSEDDLNQAAKLILDAEGVINPIVVRRTSLESYEVVDGDFEYYAAAKAREINPRKGEMIGTFIVESENEEVITQQVKVLRKQSADDNNKSKIKKTKSENSSQPDLKSINDKIEQVVEAVKKIKEIDTKHTNTQNSLEILADKVDIVEQAAKRIETLLNKLVETGVEESKETKTKVSGYSSMTKDKLKNIAIEKEIKVTTKMTKADIINALEKAEKSSVAAG